MYDRETLVLVRMFNLANDVPAAGAIRSPCMIQAVYVRKGKTQWSKAHSAN